MAHNKKSLAPHAPSPVPLDDADVHVHVRHRRLQHGQLPLAPLQGVGVPPGGDGRQLLLGQGPGGSRAVAVRRGLALALRVRGEAVIILSSSANTERGQDRADGGDRARPVR